MDISTIIDSSPEVILRKIALRVKEKRLALNLTQQFFAKRAGVGYDTYRKFENTGEITLRNLILCAIVLDEVESFTTLFAQKKWQNIDELINIEKVKERKRGTRNG